MFNMVLDTVLGHRKKKASNTSKTIQIRNVEKNMLNMHSMLI